MKKHGLFIIFIIIGFVIRAQNPLYFPPKTGNNWDTISPQSLGWCQSRIDILYNYLQTNQTKAFLVLKDGKIVLEKYFGFFTQDSLHVWNSAGKSLTAFLVGLAQEQGDLLISDTCADYLGTGWTNENLSQEDKITIKHLLTMTSGIDSAECTNPACFTYQADAGDRWDYNSAAYSMLGSILENATGLTLNDFTTQKLKLLTGMTGIFIPVQYHHIFVSNARSAARFGLMMLNKGNWDGTQIMNDSVYFNQMINTSQSLNKSYGYLWWLCNKPSYMIPATQYVFNGNILPHAPLDMYEAMGKAGQFIDVVPSKNMVLIRLGEKPGSTLVPFQMNDSIWKYMDQLNCTEGVSINHLLNNEIKIYPNPTNNNVTLSTNKERIKKVDILSISGHIVKSIKANQNKIKIHIEDLQNGFYFMSILLNDGEILIKRLVKQ